jgi:hypothetical protein
MKIFSNFRNENDPFYDDLKQIFKDKPITFFYDYIPKSIDDLNVNPYNFIMLHEPNEFFGMHTWVLNNHHLFTGILTWNETLLEKCPNAVLFYHSANILSKEYINSFQEKNKKFEVSFLSGAKSLIEGHKLRQEVYKIGDLITIPKKWFYVLDDFNKEEFEKGGLGRPDDFSKQKQICYTESMFHIAVENITHNNWFTEKISDAFNTKTVPLYWGCPNISEFGYDERGIIRFNTPEELLNIVNNLTPDIYNNMKPYIDHNYNIANNEVHLSDKLYSFFQELIELNNL